MYKRSSMLALIILLLLACGPVEQPGPGGGDQLPAAPESKATPTPTPESEATPTPTPEGEATPTPTPESEATPTPTPESPDEAPTDFLPPEPGFPPPPPVPTLKYPNLEHKLDRKAVEADEARDAAGQSDAIDTGPFVEVSIWMDTNPDDAVTQTVVDWLRNNGVSPVDVDGRAEGYGDGSFIYGTVPTSLLGELSQQEGVIGVKDTSHRRPNIW